MIIIALGALTWIGTLARPYRPWTASTRSARAADAKPLEVQVVAMDWKWLFFTPSKALPR